MHAFALALAFLDYTKQAEPDGDIDVPIDAIMSPTDPGSRTRENSTTRRSART
jgi:hypothetical protein